MLESVVVHFQQNPVHFFVILSAQYIQGELSNHLGPVIPCFLPVMGRKLIEWQIESCPEGYEPVLTIPSDYVMNPWESEIVEKLNFQLIRIPSMHLKQSLSKVLEILKESANVSNIDILYGDTIIPSIPLNHLAIAQDPKSYKWGYVDNSEERSPNQIFAGRLHCDSISNLQEVLAKSVDTVDALNFLLKRNLIARYDSEMWLDFGNLDTFYSSRRTVFTKRTFNNLQLSGKEIRKESRDNPQKVAMEARWLESVPRSMRAYFPPILEVTENSYNIPYIPDPGLDELLVHGKLSIHDWSNIFRELRIYFECSIHALEKCNVENSNLFGLENILFSNSLRRMKEFPLELRGNMQTKGEVNLQDIRDYISETFKKISKNALWGIMHGDLVFSNIMWDKRKRQLTMIDPRGQTPDGELLLFGDLRYDLAKLYQSIFFDYDWIIAGRDLAQIQSESDVEFSKVEDSFNHSIRELFLSEVITPLGVLVEDVEIIASILLLNLIPLHSESLVRQKNFVERFKKHKERTLN